VSQGKDDNKGIDPTNTKSPMQRTSAISFPQKGQR